MKVIELYKIPKRTGIVVGFDELDQDILVGSSKLTDDKIIKGN